MMAALLHKANDFVVLFFKPHESNVLMMLTGGHGDDGSTAPQSQ